MAVPFPPNLKLSVGATNPGHPVSRSAVIRRENGRPQVYRVDLSLGLDWNVLIGRKASIRY
jgi:hypothetical protein